jgi:hypothetical protein
MTKDEALKLALEALEDLNETNSYWWQDVEEETVAKIDPAITAIKEALARPEQEPVAYIHVEQRRLQWAKPMSWNTPTTVNLPKIPLYTAPPQPLQEPVCDKDPQGCWNVRCQLGKKCKNTASPAAQPEERNFCPRCGKRTADLTTIHTCTPPRENA